MTINLILNNFSKLPSLGGLFNIFITILNNPQKEFFVEKILQKMEHKNLVNL